MFGSVCRKIIKITKHSFILEILQLSNLKIEVRNFRHIIVIMIVVEPRDSIIYLLLVVEKRFIIMTTNSFAINYSDTSILLSKTIRKRDENGKP